jgi:solute carrier family 13 (sodium-dependent dicarboxylate transporter), member 2/3/5
LDSPPAMPPTQPARARSRIHLWGRLAGPLAAVACALLLPSEYVDLAGAAHSFSFAGKVTLALGVWMAIWWVTEAFDLAVTALLPPVVLPLTGAASLAAAAAPYASGIVFLMMGGFLLALSMQRWGLDRRIALLTLRLVGSRPTNMVGGIMLAGGLMGGFVSNSAQAAMLLPIGLSLIALVRSARSPAPGPAAPAAPAPTPPDAHERNFAVCMMLGIAYTCSISGVTTLIGTPPNAFLAAFVRDEIAAPYRMEISFARWMLIGVPLAAVFLPLAWLLLTRVFFPISNRPVEGGKAFVRDTYTQLGSMQRPEWCTLIVFMLMVLAWLLRPALMTLELGGAAPWRPLAGLSDPIIAMAGALLLFVIPAGRAARPAIAAHPGTSTGDNPSTPPAPAHREPRTFVMDWRTAAKLPWGVLILFGGGLSLAAAIEANGVTEFVAAHMGLLKGLPPIVLLVITILSVTLFSELASNTATATTLVPILAAMAPALGVHPYFLIVPATLAASFAFMLPAGTPPNAIVFGSGHVTMRQMCWAGIWMNLLGAVLVGVATYFLVGPVLGNSALRTKPDAPSSPWWAQSDAMPT